MYALKSNQNIVSNEVSGDDGALPLANELIHEIPHPVDDDLDSQLVQNRA